MKLEKWLKAVRECPDEIVSGEYGNRWRLSRDFGIYDNFLVFLNANHDNVAESLLRRKGYLLRNKTDYGAPRGKEDYYLIFGSKNVTLRVTGDVGYGREPFSARTPEEIKHWYKQKKDFNMRIIPSPRGDRIQGKLDLKALVEALDDLVEFAQEEKIPICFPLAKPEPVYWYPRRKRK